MKKILLLFIALAASVAAWAWSGSGTSDSPYLIKTTTDLVTLATNSASSNYYGKFFRLENNLNMSGVSIGTIGKYGKAFRGTFDGNGHAIRNLTISQPDDNYVALFGYITNDCVIKNLIIDGADITGKNRVGAIVGVYASSPTGYIAAVENCLVVNSSVTATTTGTADAGIIVSEYSGSNVTFSGNYYYNCSVTIGGNSPATTGIATNNGDKPGVVRATATVALPDGWDIITGDGYYYDGNIYTTDASALTLGPATWPALQAALSAASTDADNPTVLTLAADITASSSDTYLTLSGNRHVVLDLNGHTLSRGLTAAITDGHVISVSGSQSTLTIRDSGTGGTITGGWSTNSCGAINFGGATLTIEGGTISGNKVTMQGGSAIRCTGTVYMTGGTITGNMVSMDNYSVNQCGTIYLMNAHFYMSGGSITGNYCGITTGRGSAGIGMSLNYSGVVHLSGNYNISGNQQGTYNSATGEWTDLAPSDILNHKYLLISIDGAINPEAPARLILNSNANDRRPTFTTGWSTYMGMADPEDYFTLADNTLGIGVVNGEATIGTPHAITLGENITASATSAAPGRPITLGYNNLPEGYQVEYTVTIDGSDPTETVPVTNGTFAMPDGDVTVAAIVGRVIINEANFPDANFRDYLLAKDYGSDRVLTDEEIAGVTLINVSNKSIADLTGIEHFTALTELRCNNNQLTSLDVSHNTALTRLQCQVNQLTALDVSHNTALTYLHCDNNQLTTLDVSHNTAMRRLDCYNNQLTSLDVSHDTALSFLKCGNNQLTALDVSHNTALATLYCNHNQLTALDVSQNTALQALYCNKNQLTALDMSHNTALQILQCNNNQLTALDVSHNTALVELYCYDNQIYGENMAALVASLPTVDVDEYDDNGAFYVIDLGSETEQNVITTTQVATARGKNWNVLDSNGCEYNGKPRYTFDSETGALALNWGEFNKDNKWGSEVAAEAVKSVTATSEVSFTGDCSQLFYDFNNCESMELGNVNTDSLTITLRMFDGCGKLTTLEGISGWDVSKVTDMIAMFRNCKSLTSLDLSDWNTANVTNMSSMFAGSSGLTTLDLSGWNTEGVTSISYMFQGCSDLTSLDVSGFNTENVTDMNGMFSYCSGLDSLDLSGWNTANVTDMSYMFRDCSALTSLDVSGFNTENVTYMSSMFYNCNSLTSLDLSGFNTDSVTDMSYMFDYCSSLTTLDLSGWNTGNVTDMGFMFYECRGLTSLDVSGFNTENVTDMGSMFLDCLALTSLDLSGFNTANVEDMSGMFYYCSGLTTIYAGTGWSTESVEESESVLMFFGCRSLVGGMGTTYDPSHLNAEYARIDGGPDCPGYFTAAPQGVPGDVNGDGEVTASDITALYTFLLAGDMSEITNGDQDGDGEITTHDVTIVYEIMLGAKK